MAALLAANQGTVLPAHWRFDGLFEAKVNDALTAKIAANNIFNNTLLRLPLSERRAFRGCRSRPSVSLIAQRNSERERRC